MNKLQLTKGELTKIILEEVRNLQEQVEQSELDNANEWWAGLTDEQKVFMAGKEVLGAEE